MRVFSRFLIGFMLGKSSLSVVWRDKTLFLFPLISFGVAALIILQFYIMVGPNKLMLLVNFNVNAAGVQVINWGWYLGLFGAYLFICLVSTFFNFAMVAAVHQSMDGKDTQLRDGVTVATRNLHWVLIWGLFTSTLGILVRLADSERHMSHFLRSRLGTSWGLLTYFVLPVTIIERVSLFSAFGRSVTIMTETWGHHLRARFGLGSFLTVLCLPLPIVPIASYFGQAPIPAWEIELMVIYFAWALIVSQTAKAVLTVALYRYATTGKSPQGFREDFLKGAFETDLIAVAMAQMAAGGKPAAAAPAGSATPAPDSKTEPQA